MSRLYEKEDTRVYLGPEARPPRGSGVCQAEACILVENVQSKILNPKIENM